MLSHSHGRWSALASCSRSFQSHPSLQSQAGYGALCFKPARFLSLSTASAAATTTRQKQQQRPKGPSSQDPTPKPPRLLRTWTESRKVPSTSTGSKLQVKPAPSLRERTAEVLADEGMPLESFYLEEQDSQDEEEEEEEEEDYEYADHHSSSEDAQHRKMQSLPDFESMDLNCQHFKRGTVVDVSGGFSDICKGGQLDDSCQSSTCIIEQGGHDPNAFFCRLLQECIVNQDWTAGRRVHALIILSGLEVGNFLGSHLIRMYVSCASLAKANQVFIKLSRPNNFTWNSIISAHTKLGQAKQAIKLYFQLCQSSMEPDGHIFVAVLKACAITAAFAEGMVIHGHVFEGSFESDVFIVNSLISMYAQRGSLKDARKVFDKYSRLELVTWSVMIGEYTKQGQGHEAFKLYLKMQQRGIKPDNVIFSIVFNACSSVVDIEQCKLVHGHYIESGLESDTYVENTLLDMYAKCGSLEDAHEVFTISRHRDVVTWSGMISGYAQHGRFYEALQLFQQMQDKGLEPNHFTFACTLKACSNLGDLSHGKLIHAHIIHSGFDFDVFIKSTLIDMYAKCGSLEDAHGVFDKMSRRGVVEWSAMMSGYAMHRHGQEALQLNQLMQEEGIHLDKITLINMIKACTSASALGLAKLIHAQIAESHFECDGFIGASLIDVYAKCGTLEDARTVFNQMPDKDLVIWGAMMTGYADAEMGHEVLHLFQNLHKDGIEPNCIAVVCALKACSSLATLDLGKLIHYCVMESGCESGCESDVFAGSSLIDMYSKCGSLRDACRVFERLPRQNVVTWTAMIGGCAHHNEYKLALQYFKEMQQEGLKPDGQTFTCLLTACNHVGLVEDSRLHLISMEGKHGVAPIVDHYNCVADILGRVGCVKEAKDLLQTKTHSNNIVGWMSLLSHCRTYGNIEEGRQCFDHVMGTEP